MVSATREHFLPMTFTDFLYELYIGFSWVSIIKDTPQNNFSQSDVFGSLSASDFFDIHLQHFLEIRSQVTIVVTGGVVADYLNSKRLPAQGCIRASG